MFAKFMALVSLLLVIFTLPVSLFFVVKVVQVRTRKGILGSGLILYTFSYLSSR